MTLHEDFKREKPTEHQNYKNRATNNSDNRIANGLLWLSYAGGLGGGSPPGRIHPTLISHSLQIPHLYHLSVEASPPHSGKDMPPPPKGTPVAVSQSFMKISNGKNPLKMKNYNNQTTNNPHNEIANGLPWLSYAGGLGGRQPPGSNPYQPLPVQGEN